MNWRNEACGVCGRALTKWLILVVESRRTREGQIAIVDPPLGKFCSRECLARWAASMPPEEPEVS